MSLSQASILLLYSAMAVYGLALIAYASALATRTAPAVTPPTVTASALRAAVAYPNLAAALIADPSPDPSPSPAPGAGPGGSRWDVGRAAPALTLVAWLLHLAATVLRGLSAGRVPWANMFEFSMTATLIIIGVFLLVQSRGGLGFLGAPVVGLMLVLLGVGAVRFYVDAVPLPPALQSPWLVIHVLIAMTATALFALGFAVSALLLVQARRDRVGATAGTRAARMLEGLPGVARLDALAYRMTIIGFVLWTFTLMAGAIWAERAWGRYWGWDTKEVWTFIIWVIYAAYIHAKATRGWSTTRAAWLSVVGFTAVMFNFGIVNVFFKGLHSYSGL